MINRKWLLIILVSIFILVLPACGDKNEDSDSNQDNKTTSEQPETNKKSMNQSLDVRLINNEGIHVGAVILKQEEDAVKLTIDATDLPPGVHGFHIHENGSCEAPDFESAGGHFNPTDAKHGFDHPDGPHAGDLKNIEVQSDGTINEEMTIETVTLEKGKKNSIVNDDGTALMIHANEDDYMSQPAGEAGDRIVCGEIKE